MPFEKPQAQRGGIHECNDRNLVSQEKSMKRKILRTITLGSYALILLLGAAWQVQAQDAKAAYPSMAPLEQYLISDRNAEIALARSAAPESLSGDAEVLSQAACSDLLEPARSTILPSTHYQEDRVGVGRTIESPDVRQYQSRF